MSDNCHRAVEQDIRLFRVLACLGVFLVHLGQKLELTGTIRTVTEYGRFGVQLFFLISGYLAFSSAELKAGRIRAYYVKRAFAVLPVYYGTILLSILLYQLLLPRLCPGYRVPEDVTGLGWLRYLLILSKVVPSNVYFWDNLNGTWVIGSFVLFYLAAPAFYRIVTSLKRAFALFAVCYAASAALTACTDWFSPITSLPYFALGVILCFARRESREKLVTALSVLGLFCYNMFGKTGPMGNALLFLILLLASGGLSIKNSIAAKALTILDRYSYALYLGHTFIMGAFSWLIPYMPASRGLRLICLVVASILMSVALYHGVQQPANRLRRRLTKSDVV